MLDIKIAHYSVAFMISFAVLITAYKKHSSETLVHSPKETWL